MFEQAQQETQTPREAEQPATEWVRDYADGWSSNPILLGHHTCSYMHCEKPAVAVFTRKSGKRERRQFCCYEHLYGRRIVDGEVMVEATIGSPFWKRARELAEKVEATETTP